MIRLLYFSARGKLALSSLLNALDSSGTPVGCVRSDAQTQASHWLELEDTRAFHRCFHPLSLSPRGEKTKKKRFFSLSLPLSPSIESRKEQKSGLDTLFGGEIISRMRRAGSVLYTEERVVLHLFNGFQYSGSTLGI